MFCEFCGTKIPLGSRYCDKCGRKVESSSFQGKERESQDQLYIPSMYQGTIFDSENDLYIFNMNTYDIYDDKHQEIGKFKFKDTHINLVGELYDRNDELVFSISPTLLSIMKTYKLIDASGNQIAKIKKPPFSASLMQFYIESPFKEKWFGIFRTKSLTYKVKSYAINNQIVAEFGHIKNFNEVILDLNKDKSINYYILKVYDPKIDRAILISAFLINYLYFHT